MTQLNDACCNTPPTKTEWENLGALKVLPTKINGREERVYRTGPKDAKCGIIGMHDILGFTPTTFQFYDKLALAHQGYQVSVPDGFRNEKFVFGPDLAGIRERAMAFLSTHGHYTNSYVDELILAAVEDLRADGCTSFVIYGQCWGTNIALQAAADERMPFLAAGGPHPSLLTVEMAEKVRCPIILLPSKDEEDLVPIVEVVVDKGFAVPSFHYRFDDQVHGWTGGRGDFSDPHQRKAIEQATEFLASFTDKVVSAASA